MRTPIAILRRPDRLSRLWLVRDPEPRLEETPVDGALASQLTRMARFDVERDVDTLRALWRDTLPAPDGWPGRPPPAAVAPKPPPRPTAAHPRAFRGTKRQPPKQERPRIDLRPLLERLAVVRAAGVALAGDPYLALHHGGDGDLDALDPRFRAWVLPSLRGRAWPEVDAAHRRFVSLLHVWPDAAVELAANAAAGGVALWDGLLRRPSSTGRAWLSALSRMTDLSGTDAAALDGALTRVETLGDVPNHVTQLLGLVSRGASAAYAASGLELAARFPARSWRLEEAPAGRADGACITTALDSGVVVEDYDVCFAWQALGKRPELGPHYASLGSLEPARGSAAFRSLTSLATLPDEAWEWASRLLAWGLADGHVAPTTLVRLVRAGADDPSEARADRVKRLALAVGDRDPDVAVLLDQISFAGDLSPKLLDALESALSTTIDTECLYASIPLLDEVAPTWTSELLARHPGALLRVGARLGLLPLDRMVGLVRAVLSHPDFMPPETPPGWRRALALPRRRDPFSRALREHYADRRRLRPGQLRRHEERARARWCLARLELVEDLAWGDVSRSLEGADRTEALEHAAALLTRAGPHRRGLRRLLRAHLRGDRDWVWRHQASRDWIRRHPALDAARWRSGITTTRVISGRGSLRLSFEQDPLEVVRLGTYVGSCLALGGVFDDDAAGIALDVNKRVIFARDEAARVVARQLVAVSEADTLVCFHVYPVGSPEPIQRAFAEYDRALAEHLGVPIHREDPDGPGDSYAIASVLSASLWDDGAWDLEPVTG